LLVLHPAISWILSVKSFIMISLSANQHNKS
jgi:hypothetical protein